MQGCRRYGNWRRGAAGIAVVVCAAVGGCDNSPYTDSPEQGNVLYTTFSIDPKNLDPGRSYSGLAYLENIVEPPFQYDYLHPTELVGLTAREVPKAESRKVVYKGKTFDAIVYTIRLKPGIMYQDHPCFVEANRRLSDRDADGITAVSDFKSVKTRELKAADYVHAIRRLADPRPEVACPIYTTIAKYLLAMGDYRRELQRRLDAERDRRRGEIGHVLYNQQIDEKLNPIAIDYADAGARFPFVKEIDPLTFEIVMTARYPQMLYWMAMSFFAPVPTEAIEFFNQPVLCRRGLVFDRNPVGTGPYTLASYDPIHEIVLERNPRFRLERYPTVAAGDPARERLAAAGLLDDAGRRLPMIDRVVFRRETEAIPRWSKFLQGYYDEAVVAPDLFDDAIQLSSQGSPSLTPEMARRGIRLEAAQPSVFLRYAFNMEDDVVGGYTPEKAKLRRAISIAIDVEEAIAIFANGQGIPAHGPIPPGMFGSESGREGMNPYVYDWDDEMGRPKRKSIAQARQLLAQAGYPNGIGPDGQLVLRYATDRTSASDRSQTRLIMKQLGRLNIQLKIEVSDATEFNYKIEEGNYQFVRYGWAADYPDPENFLFLFYTAADSKLPSGQTEWGQNHSRYRNAEFERLFVEMRGMTNSPGRLAVIRRMLEILRRDAPAAFYYFPLRYGLYHQWYRNVRPRVMSHNTMKYCRIDAPARARYRAGHNKPLWWPVALLGMIVVILAVPAIKSAARQLREV